MADDYPTNLNRFRIRRNESVYLYPLMDSLPQHWGTTKPFKSMLSMGPGPGEYDIELMQRCLPSLEYYVGVERDDYCSSELEKNLKARMGGKLRWDISKANMVGWDSDKKFDIIMISHAFYNSNKQERTVTLQNCLQKLLAPDGVVLLIHITNEMDAQGRSQNMMLNIHTIFHDRMVMLADADEVLEEAQGVGAEIVYQKRYECQMDFQEFGDDITFIFNLTARPRITPALMKETIQKLQLDNGIGRYFAKLAILRKK